MFGQMKLYTVHVRPGAASAYEKPVFVREGFNFYAFIFTLFWTLYHRLWLAALGIFLVNVAFMMMAKGQWFGMEGISIMQLGVNILIGFHANDWLRARLAKRGYIMADITACDSLLRAEQRYFERLLAA
jgi:hypothetical protein